MRESAYVEKDALRKTVGPGSYNFSKGDKRKSKSVSQWKNDKVRRFKEDSSEVPGPGSYKTEVLEERKREKASSSFASTSMRSHMDNIIYQTNIPLKA